MISVKLTYTVKPEFISRNLENIQTFLVDFQKMKDADFRYTVFFKRGPKDASGSFLLCE
jgi:hypothetical protein